MVVGAGQEQGGVAQGEGLAPLGPVLVGPLVVGPLVVGPAVLRLVEDSLVEVVLVHDEVFELARRCGVAALAEEALGIAVAVEGVHAPLTYGGR